MARALAEVVVSEITQELARRSMLEFSRFVMPSFIVAPHHALLCDLADAVLHKRSRFVIINLPPRHTKSLIFSTHLPAMILGRNPSQQILHASYAASLSNKFSMEVRSMVRDNPEYRTLFPELALSDERRRVDDWRTTEGGGFRSVGTGAGISGHGADWVILDDCHKEGDELSAAVMENNFMWYVSAVRTRLAPGGSIIIPMTRWHPFDLAGRIIAESGDEWEVITLPALAGEDDRLGRRPGSALWPERYNEEWLQEQRRLSPRYFEALYQQNPQPEEGQLFWAEDFRRMKEVPKVERRAWVFDLAITESEAADWTAWARYSLAESGRVYVSDVGRHQMAWPFTKEKIIHLLRRFPGDQFVFPDHTYERMAIQELTKVEDGRYAPQIVKQSLDRDKRARASVFADRVKGGNVTVQEGADGDAFIQQHVMFPGTNDDWVDCSSTAAYYFGLNSAIKVFGLSRAS